MKCSRCGYDNPPDAARCTACDARLPAPPPPRPEIVSRERPIRPRRSLEPLAEPGTPVVHGSISPADTHGRVKRQASHTVRCANVKQYASRFTLYAARILGIRPVLTGRVVAREARWDTPPRDPARSILHLAILLLALPLLLFACTSLTVALATAALAAVCLGMEGFLLCTVPALGVLLALWGLARRPAPDEVPVLDLRIEDERTSPPRRVNVELIGARHGGDIWPGDEVELWGRWTRGGTFRAWRARLVGAGDQPIRAEVRAARPYSLPVALAALVVALLIDVALVWLLWPR